MEMLDFTTEIQDLETSWQALRDTHAELQALDASMNRVQLAINTLNTFGLSVESLGVFNDDGGLDALIDQATVTVEAFQQFDYMQKHELRNKYVAGLESAQDSLWKTFKEKWAKIWDRIIQFFRDLWRVLTGKLRKEFDNCEAAFKNITDGEIEAYAKIVKEPIKCLVPRISPEECRTDLDVLLQQFVRVDRMLHLNGVRAENLVNFKEDFYEELSNKLKVIQVKKDGTGIVPASKAASAHISEELKVTRENVNACLNTVRSFVKLCDDYYPKYDAALVKAKGTFDQTTKNIDVKATPENGVTADQKQEVHNIANQAYQVAIKICECMKTLLSEMNVVAQSNRRALEKVAQAIVSRRIIGKNAKVGSGDID